MTTATTTPIPPHSSNVSSSLTAATPSSNSPGQMLRDNWQQNVESGGHGSEHSAPPSDPPVALPSFPPQSTAPSSYYLPSSPNEMFLASYPPPSLGPDANRKPTKMTEYEKDGREKKVRNEEEGGGTDDDDNDDVAAYRVLNRRQTRLYRCLVWVQFSLSIFSCLFIMAILVLVAVILVLLQRTIDKADTAIRGNPVSQVYMKIKNAVDKLPG